MQLIAPKPFLLPTPIFNSHSFVTKRQPGHDYKAKIAMKPARPAPTILTELALAALPEAWAAPEAAELAALEAADAAELVREAPSKYNQYLRYSQKPTGTWANSPEEAALPAALPALPAALPAALVAEAPAPVAVEPPAAAPPVRVWLLGKRL